MRFQRIRRWSSGRLQVFVALAENASLREWQPGLTPRCSPVRESPALCSGPAGEAFTAMTNTLKLSLSTNAPPRCARSFWNSVLHKSLSRKALKEGANDGSNCFPHFIDLPALELAEPPLCAVLQVLRDVLEVSIFQIPRWL